MSELEYKKFDQKSESKVFEFIEDIVSGKVLLPLIQRDFVWNDEQMVNLFDSIYRGYPIGSFLIWVTKKSEVKEMRFSNIIRFYNPYISVLEISNLDNVIEDDNLKIILDGQQRVTALYIGLNGLYGEKSPGRGTYVVWKGLFIDLLGNSENGVFKFFPIYGTKTVVEAKSKNQWKECFYFDNESIDMRNRDIARVCIENIKKKLFENKNWYLTKIYPNFCKNHCHEDKLWFPVWELYKMARENKTRTLIKEVKNNIKASYGKKISKENKKKIENTIKRFLGTFKDERVLHYYKLKTKELNEAFEIFNRINTGGTFLSKSDVIFGYISAYWKEAKEKFSKLLDEINQKIHGTNRDGFNVDFLIRTILMIVPYSKGEENRYRNVTPKINEILKDKDLPNDIRNNWNKIEDSVKSVVEFVSKLGIYNDDLVSKNVLIPIIYFVYRNLAYKDTIQKSDEYISNGNEEKIQRLKELLKYLFASLLNKVFSSHGDRLLENLRDVLNNEKEFKYLDVAYKLKEKMPEKDLIVDFSIIEDETKPQYAKVALKALWIFKNLNKIKNGESFFKISGTIHELEVDHIFPKSLFTEESKKVAIDEFVKAYFENDGGKANNNNNARTMLHDFYSKNQYEFYSKKILEDKKELRSWLNKKIEEWIDRLPNKMLLRGKHNKQKHDKLLSEFLKELDENENEKNELVNELIEYGYIPKEYSLNNYLMDVKDFIFFYLKRYQELEEAFNEIFNEKT